MLKSSCHYRILGGSRKMTEQSTFHFSTPQKISPKKLFLVGKFAIFDISHFTEHCIRTDVTTFWNVPENFYCRTPQKI